jgi:hypothetical protein
MQSRTDTFTQVLQSGIQTDDMTVTDATAKSLIGYSLHT